MFLDDFDRKILRRMQADVRATGVEIGEEVCLSAAAVGRRIQRLRKHGVIVAEVALVDPAVVGLPMTFIIGVELECQRPASLDAFRKAVRADPSVQQCYHVAGVADFMLVVLARDIADFESVTHRLLLGNGNVRRYTTSVVRSRDKIGCAAPI
jgi:Lrp/AsnC family transcriptional regulator, leucine-responsive regulatory protein